MKVHDTGLAVEYWDRLIEACPVKFYCSGIDGARTFWPWRMNKAGSKEFRPAYVNACDHHILDSHFGDESVTNAVVLDEAVRSGCDAAVLADVYQDCEATIEALLDGLDLADDHGFDGTIVLPLQEPFDECYDAVVPSVGDRDVWWALGGLKDVAASVKVNAVRDFRNYTGSEIHIHGLGWGITEELARAVRRDPDLLDSVDNSTAVSNTVGGYSGDEQTSVTALLAQAHRVQQLRRLTHYTADANDPAQIREPGQLGLAGFATPIATDGGLREGDSE